MTEDYGGSKSSGTVAHQTLPAFSPPFSSRFTRFSPTYASPQATAAAVVDVSSWPTYATAGSETGLSGTNYATAVSSGGRRQGSGGAGTPGSAQHQLSAAASLSASEYFFHGFLQGRVGVVLKVRMKLMLRI